MSKSQDSTLTVNRTCTSSIYTATYTQLMEDFNCSREVVTLGLTLFVLGMGCGPMLLGPLSEVQILSPLPSPFAREAGILY